MAIDPKDKLVKAAASVAATSDDRTAWQEPFARHLTVPATKSSQAPEILKGFVGSWAGQWALEETASSEGSVASGVSPGVQVKRNRLGLDGWPEVNFRPYDPHTLMSGRNGPSLLGHPISYEFVGPTLKGHNIIRNANVDHQWSVTVGVNEDTLTLDTVSFESTSNAVTPPAYSTIEGIYGITAVPPEGLYLYVLDSGSDGSLTTQGAVNVEGGVGDGRIGQDATIVRNALTPLGPDSKYEIFRVVNVTADGLVLDSNKRLSAYFSVMANPVIRAVALIKPAAARLVPVPGTGNKVYSFLPPKEALTGDFWPMHDEYGIGSRLSAAYGYAEQPGDPSDYQYKVPTPVKYSTEHFRAEYPGALAGLQIAPLGHWKVWALQNGRLPQASDVGKIMRVREVDCTPGMAQWKEGQGFAGAAYVDPGIDRVMGYFEITAVDSTPGAENWSILAHPSWDMDNGQVWWPEYEDHGFGQFGGSFIPQQGRAYIEVSLHEKVETLWQGTYLHPEVLETTRLRNIIDPAWAGMSAKGNAAPGINLARADKALFDTSSSNGGNPGANANPGSLLDLGFRPVFFPATKYGADPNWSANFDSPIDTRGEIILDPSVPTEDQWIRIDYSAGLVYLSHAPALGTDLFRDFSLANVEADNARGEPFFFASFVPFSQEPGQLGGNPRVAGNDGTRNPGCVLGEGLSDVFGARKFWSLYPQILTERGHQNPSDPLKYEIILNKPKWLSTDIPSSGWVTLVKGTGPGGEAVFIDDDGNEVSTFRYEGIGSRLIGSNPYPVLLNVSGSGQIGTGGFVVDGSNPVTAVFRKDIETSPSIIGDTGTDYRQDVTTGFAARASVLRFEGATVRRQGDGSVSIHTKDPQVDEHTALFGNLFSSWVLEGAGVSTTFDNNEISISPGAVIMKGRRIEWTNTIEWGTSELPNSADVYIYLRSDVDLCNVYPAATTTLPLPNSDDILLARVQTDGAGVVTVSHDLRRPLADIDKRIDITVGQSPSGHPQPLNTNFALLSEAIAYMDQLCKSGTLGSQDGIQHRIRVVGGTTEPASSVPITLPNIEGLIIEGSSLRIDPSQPHTHAIYWGGTNNPLFRVNADTGARYVFRNLNFVYDGAGVVDDLDPAQRVLFHLDGGMMDGFILENLNLMGFNGTTAAHGLVFSNSGIGGMTNCVVQGCKIDATDFGVYLTQDTSFFLRNKFLNNHFEVSRFPTTSLADAAVVWSPPLSSADNSGFNLFQGNHFEGGNLGLALQGQHDVVRDNEITQASHMAVRLFNTADGIWVVDNVLSGGQNAAGKYFLFKAGFAIEGGTKNHVIRGNRITLSNAKSTDSGIEAAASTACHYVENYIAESMVFGSSSTVTDNVVEGSFGAAGHGENSIVKGNVITGQVTLGGGVTFSDNICVALVNVTASSQLSPVVLANNRFLQNSGTHVGGDSAHFQGNIFLTTLQLAPRMRVTDNQFDTSGRSPLTSLARDLDVLIRANWFEASTSITFRGIRSEWSGNHVDATYVDFDDSFETRIVGNYFSGGMQQTDTSGLGGDCQISANHIQGGAYLKGFNHQFVGNNINGTISAPVAKTYSLECDGDRAHIIGNKVGSDGIGVAIVADGDDCIIQGNDTVSLEVCVAGTGLRPVIVGNRISGGFTNTGNVANGVFKGNHVLGNVILNGVSSEWTLSGNLVGGQGGINATGANHAISNNVLYSSVTSLTVGDGNNVIGNQIRGDSIGDNSGISINLGTKQGTRIVGNVMDGSIDGFGGVTQIADNRCGGINLTFAVSGNIISNNVVAGDLNNAGPSTQIQNNAVAGVLANTGDNPYIIGNRVTGNLTNTGSDPNISFNNCGSQLLQDAAGYTLVGNRVTVDVNTVALSNVDPDAGGGIAIGNRLNISTTAPGGPWYGAAPPDTGGDGNQAHNL